MSFIIYVDLKFFFYNSNTRYLCQLDLKSKCIFYNCKFSKSDHHIFKKKYISLLMIYFNCLK